MNFSICSADRATHLRIAVAALVASSAIVAFAVSVQVHGDRLLTARPLSDRKVDAPKEYASRELRSNPLTKIAIR
jgi:hypothetical protein